MVPIPRLRLKKACPIAESMLAPVNLLKSGVKRNANPLPKKPGGHAVNHHQDQKEK